MRYFSTRGSGAKLSFSEAVLTGLAPDGGLYIPESIPSLPANWESDWASYSFQELSLAVLSLYISPEEISSKELQGLVERSYSTFRHPGVTPLTKVNDERWVLELWHGPTWAFKDVALQLLGNLFEFILDRQPDERSKKLTVVGATSGDTGSAAIYGLRSKAHITTFILHPKGRVSPIQEAQMTTVLDPSVHNIAVKGTFDDCQDIVKALFSDVAFNKKHRLGAINSINWARILAQTVYYFLAYFHLKRIGAIGKGGLQFVVPTGNFGDILAGYYAKKMGLPIKQLCIATNANDILTRFFQTGDYSKPANGVVETTSPAMDILISSNFERLLWYLAHETGGDTESKEYACGQVSNWISEMKSTGRVHSMSPDVVTQGRKDFRAERVDDDETLKTIQEYFTSHSYLIDPHTAVGLAAAPRFSEPDVTQVILSTAHPAKFSEAVSRALADHRSFDFDRDATPVELKGLLGKEKRVIDVDETSVEAVKEVIERLALKP